MNKPIARKVDALYNHTLIKPVFQDSDGSVLVHKEEFTNVALVISSEKKAIVGKEIYFEPFGAKKVVIEGEKLLFIKNEDILGVCKNN